MALPTSPPISLNQIKAEFGATGSRSLTEFYRGGAFVPDTPANSGVPTSGSISLLDFLGSSSFPALTDAVLANFTSAPGTSLVNLFVRTNGEITTVVSASNQTPVGTLPTQWLYSGNASDYDVRFTITDRRPSNTVVQTGTFGTWMSLTSDRSVAMTSGPNESSNIGLIPYEADILVEFRRGSTIVGDVTYTLRTYSG